VLGLRGKSKYVYRRGSPRRISPHRITPINGERVEEAETFEKYEIRQGHGVGGEEEKKKRQGEKGKQNKSRGSPSSLYAEMLLWSKCCSRAVAIVLFPDALRPVSQIVNPF